jgi:hypothetical protein
VVGSEDAFLSLNLGEGGLFKDYIMTIYADASNFFQEFLDFYLQRRRTLHNAGMPRCTQVIEYN